MSTNYAEDELSFMIRAFHHFFLVLPYVCCRYIFWLHLPLGPTVCLCLCNKLNKKRKLLE